jgi:phenylpyruvate tautomerase PptA (4-oxalocrotonate tautomerase family)
MLYNIWNQIITNGAHEADKVNAWIESSDEGLKEYSTAARWNQYQAHTITREQAVALAQARASKKQYKRTQTKVKELETIATGADTQSIDVIVVYVRSKTWGWNPHATVLVYTNKGIEEYHGTASGCGYDKPSAAIAEALNKSPSARLLLCLKKDAAMRASNVDTTDNEKYIAYGAGYGEIPCFAGGVGITALKRLLEACGLVLDTETGTGSVDYYHFTKKED